MVPWAWDFWEGLNHHGQVLLDVTNPAEAIHWNGSGKVIAATLSFACQPFSSQGLRQMSDQRAVALFGGQHTISMLQCQARGRNEPGDSGRTDIGQSGLGHPDSELGQPMATPRDPPGTSSFPGSPATLAWPFSRAGRRFEFELGKYLETYIWNRQACHRERRGGNSPPDASGAHPTSPGPSRSEKQALAALLLNTWPDVFQGHRSSRLVGHPCSQAASQCRRHLGGLSAENRRLVWGQRRPAPKKNEPNLQREVVE